MISECGKSSSKGLHPAQAAFEGHGFAARTVEPAATATSLSPAPTMPPGKGPSLSSEPLQATSSAFLSLGQRGGAKGRTRSEFPERQTQKETVTSKGPQV